MLYFGSSYPPCDKLRGLLSNWDLDIIDYVKCVCTSSHHICNKTNFYNDFVLLTLFLADLVKVHVGFLHPWYSFAASLVYSEPYKAIELKLERYDLWSMGIFEKIPYFNLNQHPRCLLSSLIEFSWNHCTIWIVTLLEFYTICILCVKDSSPHFIPIWQPMVIRFWNMYKSWLQAAELLNL